MNKEETAGNDKAAVSCAAAMHNTIEKNDQLFLSIINNKTRKLHDSMFYRTGVIVDRSFTLREWAFSTFFAPVILTLTLTR